ncbi:NAD(P)H-quinone oxidoreductase subunit 5 [Arsukibacterium tuosuense]|uniref:Probable inorganic carbon transporter subunit DabB n=1 Tax=Arsukibacterium tuosuense TaxID=1323745 RepID=A0A285IMV8_9GAMM|nr:NADH-quinone oxidoreductase subunit L [Arsukibacterium tuosuense]SNY49308.1 NAD(P)H-quinone oxidoreductase subunit 5 [Arsukibacterium tuosuense]
MNSLLAISSLKLVLLALVALLAVVIWRYSATALAGEQDKLRFMRALALTLTATVFTLLSNHLLLFWLGWCWISLSLQQLLLFYPERPRAQLAAHKKALSARAGEILLAGAFILLYIEFGTAEISDIVSQASGQHYSLSLYGHVATVLLVLVALIKCAQLPLHGWLIQVVEAPTPVSALLHAGIINLGGILLLLFSPLLKLSAAAAVLLLVTALISTVLAALIMTTRISIKVRLAWSTIAQMGLMLVEIALGLYTLALLHLLAHSCYKAYAFLHSGNAVNHYLAAQLAGQTEPQARHWLLALLVTSALVILAHQILPLSSLSSAVLLVLAVTVLLMPSLARADSRRPLRVMLAVAYGVGLLALYSSGKYMLQPIAPTTQVFSTWADVFTSLVFAGLFVMAVLLRYHSRHRAVNRVFIWLNAGGYLDEWATRVTLKIWPYHNKTSVKTSNLSQAESLK